MVHDLNTKNLQINGLFFFQNPKIPFLGGAFGPYPQIEIFSKNPAPSGFYSWGTLTSLDISEKSVLENMLLPTDILTYWHTDRGEIIGPFFTESRGSKNNMLFVVFFNKIIVYITKSCVLYNACNLVHTLYTSFLTPQAKWYLVSRIKFVN